MFIFFFFFQAEDGIRDRTVTGVQTCALPISTFPSWSSRRCCSPCLSLRSSFRRATSSLCAGRAPNGCRSEERRVGKECRLRWERYLSKTNIQRNRSEVVRQNENEVSAATRQL